MKKKKKCYIYIRVSTAMQVEGYSLEAQKERLTKFAAFQEMEVVREYCDAGKSGKSITGRPEFTRMLQDIAESGEDIDFILVFKLSRFGRNAADVLNSLQYIQDYGVNLICVEDGIDSSKDSGKLTITVLSAVAEIERENILVQTMEGRKQKACEGKWNGGQAPFGYTLDSKNSTLVVNPEEAEMVRLIFDKFVHTDMGADTICDYLNQHGYTKKKVRDQEVSHFTRSFLMRVLDNPVYTGKIAYGKSATEKVKGSRDEYKRVKTDDYLLTDGLHDAIIDEVTWEAARQKRKRTGLRWVKTHSLEHEHILSGIIKCPLCGAGMTGTVYRRHNKKTDEYKDTFYYRCHHRKRADGKQCDFAPKLNQDKFNSEVEDVIRYMVREGRFREYMKNKLDEQVDVSYLEDEKKQLQGQLQQVQGAKKKLLQMIDRLDSGDRHYDQKYQDMSDRLDNLYDRISELDEEIAGVDARIQAAYEKQITGKNVYQFLLDFATLYERMTDLEKKQFMRMFIERIELYPEKKDNGRIISTIELRFPVYYDGQEGNEIRMPDKNTVETCVLLSKLKSTQHIEVKIDLDEVDLTKAESKATYAEIKEYVLEKYGLKVSQLYIAQVKRKHGIIERINYNVGEGKAKVPQVPMDKEKAIEDALRYFQMI